MLSSIKLSISFTLFNMSSSLLFSPSSSPFATSTISSVYSPYFDFFLPLSSENIYMLFWSILIISSVCDYVLFILSDALNIALSNLWRISLVRNAFFSSSLFYKSWYLAFIILIYFSLYSSISYLFNCIACLESS